MTPEEVRAIVRDEVRSQVASELAGLTFQSGQGISVSGSGKNWTISAQAVTWTGTGQCNGDGSISINLQSN